jgi:hypothetical protein
MQKLT